MKGVELYLILFSTTFACCIVLNSNFVRDYYVHRGIKQIVLISCLESFDTLNFMKNLMDSDLQISYLVDVYPHIDFKKVFRVNYYKLGIFLNLDCMNSKYLLQRFHHNGISYNESYYWLIQTTNEVVPYEIFRPLQLSINCEMTIAVQKENNTYSLYDIYNPSYRHGGSLNVTFMGEWSPKSGLINKLTQYKYKRRSDLHGMYLNFSVAIFHTPKNVDFETYLITPTDKHLDTMNRFNYALTLYLKDYYNFTINLLKGATWGYKVNGTFNGILGDMIKGTVDIAVSPFRIRTERLDVIDYTVQNWVVGTAVIFRHPKKNELRNQFFKPFSRQIWNISTIVAVFCWAFLYLTVKVEHYYDKKEPIITLHTIPASETALITTAAVCQQGLSDGPRLYSGRIVFISVFLWALLVYQFYSASIVRSLLAAPPRFITTPTALLECSMEMGAEDVAYNYDLFATQPDPVIIALNKKKLMPNKHRQKPSYFTAEEGLKKVQRGNFAFFVDVATAYKIIEDSFTDDEICDLQEIQLIAPVHTATVVAKHSPFRKMITYGQRKIVERGMTDRLRHIWRHRKPQCPESHSALPTPVALIEFSPALFMFIVGVMISILVMLVESVIRKYWYRLQSSEIKTASQVFSLEN